MQDLTDSQASPPDEWVFLTKRYSQGEAHELQLLLESNGVNVFVLDKTPVMWYGVGATHGGVQIHVPKSQLQQAFHLVKNWDAENKPLPPPLECPVCHSKKVNQSGALGAIVCAVFACVFAYMFCVDFLAVLIPGLIVIFTLLWWFDVWSRCKCRDCKHAWKIKKHAS